MVEDEEFEYPSHPPIFLSYQWGMQDEVKLLKQHLNMAGYECWMDIGQMGGGDKLFAKIDNGIRAAKVIICCVTEKYAQSPNCNREVGKCLIEGIQILEAENALIIEICILHALSFVYEVKCFIKSYVVYVILGELIRQPGQTYHPTANGKDELATQGLHGSHLQ